MGGGAARERWREGRGGALGLRGGGEGGGGGRERWRGVGGCALGDMYRYDSVKGWPDLHDSRFKTR